MSPDQRSGYSVKAEASNKKTYVENTCFFWTYFKGQEKLSLSEIEISIMQLESLECHTQQY